MGHIYSCGDTTAVGEITLYVEENTININISYSAKGK
jgi:hypothetical protein